jgi:hypothetical protein
LKASPSSLSQESTEENKGISDVYLIIRIENGTGHFKGAVHFSKRSTK